jgi:hypothetical protein
MDPIKANIIVSPDAKLNPSKLNCQQICTNGNSCHDFNEREGGGVYQQENPTMTVAVCWGVKHCGDHHTEFFVAQNGNFKNGETSQSLVLGT